MSIPENAERALAGLSTRERVAQMVFPRVAGLHQADGGYEVRRVGPWIRDERLGGLILFGGNLFETAAAMNALQNEAEVPLLIAADLETGAGQQVTGATRLPPAMALGAAEDEELSRRAGRITAVEARAFGIHLVLAPVADLNTEPDNPIVNARAFGDDPEAAAKRVVAFVEGCLDGDALPTVKHFPGHGATAKDSHLALPTLDVPVETLEKREWPPFRAAFAAGAPACMVGHLMIPELDPERPASLSPRVIRGLLRERMGFNGLVVSDALTMGGATEGIGVDEACVRAAEAGNDVLLHPEDPVRVIEAVTAAVESGRIPESTIEAAARRILTAKERLGLFGRRMVEVGRIDEVLAAHAELPQRIAEAAITCVRDPERILPLRLGPEEVLSVVTAEEEAADAEPAALLVRALHKHRPRVRARRIRFGMTDAEVQQAIGDIPPSGPLLVGIFSRTRGYKGSARLAHDLKRFLWGFVNHTMRACLVSFGNPYVLNEIGPDAAAIAAYSDIPAAMEAAADALLGRIPFRGKLPVRMPL